MYFSVVFFPYLSFHLFQRIWAAGIYMLCLLYRARGQIASDTGKLQGLSIADRQVVVALPWLPWTSFLVVIACVVVSRGGHRPSINVLIGRAMRETRIVHMLPLLPVSP